MAAVKEYFVELVEVKGDGLTVYTDANVPFGGRLLDAFGNQVFYHNGDRFVMADPTSPILFDWRPYLKFEGGVLAYAQVWPYNPETGHGDDVIDTQGQKVTVWVEVRGHIKTFVPGDDSGPEPEPEETPKEVSLRIKGLRWDAGLVLDGEWVTK